MTLIDIAAAGAKELGLDAVRVEGFPVLNVNVKVPNGKLDMFIHAHEDARRLLVYTRPQAILVRDEVLPALGEFLTRANYGLPLGNFELDMNDGELNFKNSVDVNGAELTSAMVKTLISFSLECVNHYLPGLHAVLDGTAPKQAIEAIDGPTRIKIT
jgi:hypothetical protein